MTCPATHNLISFASYCNSIARFALATTALPAISILRSELMALFAVCSGEVHGARCDSSGQIVHNAPAQVFFSGNWLQVIRIYAAMNATEMVKVKPFRYRAFKRLIDHPMGKFWNAMFAWISNYRESTVSVYICSAEPEPAAGVRFWRNLGEQSGNYWYSGSTRHVTPFSRIGQGCAALDMPLRPVFYYTPGVSA